MGWEEAAGWGPDCLRLRIDPHHMNARNSVENRALPSPPDWPSGIGLLVRQAGVFRLGSGRTPSSQAEACSRIDNLDGRHLTELAKLQGTYLGCRVPDVEIT